MKNIRNAVDVYDDNEPETESAPFRQRVEIRGFHHALKVAKMLLENKYTVRIGEGFKNGEGVMLSTNMTYPVEYWFDNHG